MSEVTYVSEATQQFRLH